MNDDDLVKSLERLPELAPGPTADAAVRRALAQQTSMHGPPSMPVAGRVVLFATVFVYLGWALNAASALMTH